jgi:hypothetical protein
VVFGETYFRNDPDQHLKFKSDDKHKLSILLLTMAQKMGVHADTFSDSTGTSKGMT